MVVWYMHTRFHIYVTYLPALCQGTLKSFYHTVLCSNANNTTVSLPVFLAIILNMHSHFFVFKQWFFLCYFPLDLCMHSHMYVCIHSRGEGGN